MFDLPIPIVQAPMLGASSRAMTLAASQAGALGSYAGAGAGPETLKAEIASLREALGETPFAVNLFILAPAAPNSGEVAKAIAQLAAFRAELGLGPQAIPNRWAEDFVSQFDALVEAAPPAASFTFGILTPDQCAALKSRGTKVIGTATTLAEAIAWRDVGADAICAQGMEAGGHRGTFLKPVEESLVGIAVLLPAIKRAVDLPVIAAGGIMDGKGVAAMLALGADLVQMGTAFLLSDETAISAPWQAALKSANADDTRLTRAFSGRHARGIENRFMREFAGKDIPPYPIQNALTQELRASAGKASRADMLSLWAGQGVGLIREGTTSAIIQSIWTEAKTEMARLSTRYT